MTRFSRLLGSVLLASLLAMVTACSSAVVVEEDDVPAVVLLAGTDVVVLATIEDVDAPLEGYSTRHSRGIAATVEETIWHVGEAVLGGRLTPIPAPVVGERILVHADRDWEFGQSSRLLLFLNHLTGVPDAEVVWFLKLAADPESGALVGGIDAATQAALANERLLEPSESAADRVSALVDLVDQLTASHRAMLLGEAVHPAARMERVMAVFSEPQVSPLDAWLATPADRRQLPIDVAELPPGADLALAVEWVHREAVVLYDAATLGEFRWIGLEFTGVGVLGPFFLDQGLEGAASEGSVPGVLHTVVLGTAPKATPFAIMAWGEDTSTEPLTLGQVSGRELADLDEKGYLIIDLRVGLMVDVVDEQSYLRFVNELAP